MARMATEEEKIRAAAHVVGLLNEAKAILTGWVLQMDQEAVEKVLDPLYNHLDEI